MKINYLKKNLFLLIFLATTSVMVAQQNGRYSLEMAKIRALDYNIDAQNQNIKKSQAQEQIKEAISASLPQLNATVDYNNYLGASASLMPGMDIEFNPTSNLTVTLSQVIFNQSVRMGIKSAHLYSKVVETSVAKSKLELKAMVTELYLVSLISVESCKIIESNLQNITELMEKTELLTKTGFAESTDYDMLAVQYSMLKDALRAAERQSEVSLNMLRLQMGLEPNEELVLTDNFDRIISRMDYNNILSKELDITTSPDFKLTELQHQLSLNQVKMEQAAYLPSLAGFYNYTEKLLKADLDLTPNHVVGLSLQIPIISGGSKKSRLRQARMEEQISVNTLDLVQRQLDIQHKQLKFNLASAMENYDSQKSNLDVAKRVYNSFTNKYNQGVVSGIDLISANNNYLQAQNSYLNSMLQLTQSGMELEKLHNTL
ncbi:MAG: TolC family protein [Paludibacter sp.]|nr:TolC family protein [Paludibacter sp.]